MIDTQEIEKQIKDNIKSKVDSVVKDDQILLQVSRMIDSVIAERVNSIITQFLNNLLQKGKIKQDLETKYQDKLYAVLEKESRSFANQTVGAMDLPNMVSKNVYQILDSKIKTSNLPEKFINHKIINWDGYKISADNISEGTIENFSSSGIQDVSSNIELTIADNVVVVENSFVTRNAEVKENLFAPNMITNTLKVNDQLILSEQINKQFISLIRDTFTNEISKRKIDIAQTPLYLNDKEVLTENSLGTAIIHSNLRKLGRLTELNVSGYASFNDTLLVTDSGKIGINTSEPEGALTIWDDDSELTIKRLKKKNIFIGTLRDTDLSIGSHGDVKISLRKDGTVEINQLEISGLKISVSSQVPTRTGKPGEIVIMSSPTEDEPWAYRCLGNDKWKAIK